jgi:hypothetical protein
MRQNALNSGLYLCHSTPTPLVEGGFLRTGTCSISLSRLPFKSIGGLEGILKLELAYQFESTWDVQRDTGVLILSPGFETPLEIASLLLDPCHTARP